MNAVLRPVETTFPPFNFPDHPPKSGGSLAPHFAHDELLAPRDRQRLRHAGEQDLPVRVAVVVHAALEAAYVVTRGEAVPMDAHEPRSDSVSSLVNDSSSRYSRCDVLIVMYFSSALR